VGHSSDLKSAFAFQNVPAMLTFFLVFNLLAVVHKLEKPVILIITGKDRKFTCLALVVTSA
jgi:hypothetical protein